MPTWQTVVLLVGVIALGVSAGTSFVSSSGSVTVATIWQHNPISWTEVDTETGWCAASCPTTANSEQTWLAWDPTEGNLTLLTLAGGATGTYDFALGSTYSYPVLKYLPQKCTDTCPPAESVGTSAGGTDWGAGATTRGVTFGPNMAFEDGSSAFDSCRYSNSTAYYPWYCTAQTTDNNPAGSPELGFDPHYAYYTNTVGVNIYYDDKGGFMTVANPLLVPTLMTLTCQNPSKTVITCPTDLVPSTGTVSGAAMVWDPADGYTLLYDVAGYSWELYVTSSTAILARQVSTSVGAPGPLYGASIAYDAACGYVLMFGGSTSSTITSTSLQSSTWKYHAGTWTQIVTVAANDPTARAWGGMAYDMADGEMVLDGGTIWSSGATAGTTSAYVLSPAMGGCG